MSGADSLGRDFATALAGKDFGRITELLDPEVDFRALTPNRSWEASSATEVVAEILTRWFDDSNHVEELVDVESTAFADVHRVGYRFRGHDDDGPFIVEQQTYFAVAEGRITWLRVLCSGNRRG